MYAVVEIAGKQLRVDKGDLIKVPLLDAEEGSKHSFSDVLLISADGKTHIGQPHVAGASVKATVLGHGKDKKVVVFKMKRRKKYRRRNGHRQQFTSIQIDDIAVSS
jgi:large subunit ribosomal protein L21